jgi:murein L,D-transpeptidase YcbB/YkuD
LPPGALAPAANELPRYQGDLVEAVRRFQLRHGLEADGVIGSTTWTQLGIEPAARVHQIELALERLRWTPFLQSRRMVVVNLPEFVLRAYEVADDGRVQLALESRVVVGRALDTRTPLFDEDMRFIEFSPYWNIPPSIARSETVPKLRRDPGYFDRMGFEFVGADGSVQRSLSSAHLDAVLAGRMRIRQRPGEHNALGDIKFVFPNADNIYLHHTPAVDLFGRARRDYSNGCIRVEKPVELAEFVLQGMPGWDRARIEAAMAQGKSNTLKLAEPVPVLLSYGTTLVKGDQIFFFNDIYGHDRVLAQALQQRSRSRAK